MKTGWRNTWLEYVAVLVLVLLLGFVYKTYSTIKLVEAKIHKPVEKAVELVEKVEEKAPKVKEFLKSGFYKLGKKFEGKE